jgi:hypothetical protein
MAIPAYKFSGKDMTSELYLPLLDSVTQLKGIQSATLMTEVPLGKTFLLTYSFQVEGKAAADIRKRELKSQLRIVGPNAPKEGTWSSRRFRCSARQHLMAYLEPGRLAALGRFGHRFGFGVSFKPAPSLFLVWCASARPVEALRNQQNVPQAALRKGVFRPLRPFAASSNLRLLSFGVVTPLVHSSLQPVCSTRLGIGPSFTDFTEIFGM